MTKFAIGLSLGKRAIKKIARTPAWLVRSIVSQYRQSVRQVVLFLTDRYWLIDYLPKRSAGNNSVLLVRLDLIGDFVIWLDAAKEFKTLYPNKNIVLYANSSWASLAEKLSYWDQVVTIDVPRLRADHLYRLRFLVQTRWQGFGIAIQPTYSREYVGDLVIRATQAAQRIAHLGDFNNITAENKTISDAWYTRLISTTASPAVEFTLNAELIRSLGKPEFKSALPILPVLAELPSDMEIKTRYCVIVPGASWAPKTWPIDNFAQVAKQIKGQYGLKIVLCGTASEQGLCRQLAMSCGGEVLDFAGKTSLIQFVELIRYSALVVANDSSSVHIAAATGVQAVCILGGGHYGRFLPYHLDISSAHQFLPEVLNENMDCYGCHWRCKHLTQPVQLVPCVSSVSLERVVDVCFHVLTHQRA